MAQTRTNRMNAPEEINSNRSIEIKTECLRLTLKNLQDMLEEEKRKLDKERDVVEGMAKEKGLVLITPEKCQNNVTNENEKFEESKHMNHNTSNVIRSKECNHTFDDNMQENSQYVRVKCQPIISFHNREDNGELLGITDARYINQSSPNTNQNMTRKDYNVNLIKNTDSNKNGNTIVGQNKQYEENTMRQSDVIKQANEWLLPYYKTDTDTNHSNTSTEFLVQNVYPAKFADWSDSNLNFPTINSDDMLKWEPPSNYYSDIFDNHVYTGEWLSKERINLVGETTYTVGYMNDIIDSPKNEFMYGAPDNPNGSCYLEQQDFHSVDPFVSLIETSARKFESSSDLVEPIKTEKELYLSELIEEVNDISRQIQELQVNENV